VAVEGRLDWREWEAKDGGGKRQAVQIIANTVQFLGSRDGSGGGGGGNGNGGGFTPTSDVPADTSDFEGASVAGGGGEDDIPF
jgi:single-strand DNA-binding protein